MDRASFFDETGIQRSSQLERMGRILMCCMFSQAWFGRKYAAVGCSCTALAPQFDRAGLQSRAAAVFPHNGGSDGFGRKSTLRASSDVTWMVRFLYMNSAYRMKMKATGAMTMPAICRQYMKIATASAVPASRAGGRMSALLRLAPLRFPARTQ